MPQTNEQQLKQALQNAHAAGDTQAAARLARMIQDLRGQQAAPQQQPQQESTAPITSFSPQSQQVLQQQEPERPQEFTLGDVSYDVSQTPTAAENAILEEYEQLRQQGAFQAVDAPTGEQIRIAGGFLLNADPQARMDILRETLGEEVTFETDNNGRTIVNYRDERAYLNPPGFDSSDAIQLAAEFLKFTPAGRVARVFGGGARAAPGVAAGSGASAVRAGTAGSAAAAGTQAASEAASGAFGSEQGIDPFSVGIAGLGALVGEPLIARRMIRGVTPGAQQAEQTAQRMGVDLSGTPGTQVAQLSGAAQRQMPPPVAANRPIPVGQNMPNVQLGVRLAREQERQIASQRFTQSRSMSAAIPQRTVADFNQNVQQSLQQAGYRLQDEGMGPLRNRIAELDNLATAQGEWPRRLNALESWRQGVSKVAQRGRQDPSTAAARQLLGEYDDWLTGVLNNDLIRGNPNAVAAWQQAREGWKSFRNRFDSDRVIRDLVNKETTPEQMRRWVFNANAVGARAEAAQTVSSLNNILGSRSPRMAGLRAEAMLDIAEPLIRETPDIEAFLSNYNRWLRNNDSLFNALFPGELAEPVTDLANFARSIGQRAGTKVSELKPNDSIGRVLQATTRLAAGNVLAFGTERMRVSQGLVNWIRRQTTGASGRRRIIQEVTGLDNLDGPLLSIDSLIGPVNVGTTGGAAATTFEDRAQ